MSLDLEIRLADEKDVAPINDIYNHYVLTSTCTYQEEPSTLPERLEWFKAHGPAHPITVAVIDGEVVGWASASPYHPRAAYRHTVENSVYIRHDMHGKGLGKAMLLDLIARCTALGHKTMIAGISADQAVSIGLHEALGFEPVGHLKEVGFKFDRWLDVIYMQRMLNESSK